ncbi:hypothetical protein AB0J80_23660 [Actinoplanes sp. NPDC049548]|uniref:hypothetical protein n=1 Tax=Actinoplanes sp. NPDC049548 TaxID=3155152 RepID=UPI003412523A
MNTRRMIAAAALAAIAGSLVPGAAYAAGPDQPNPNCKLVAGRATESVDIVSGSGRAVIRRGCGTDTILVKIERSRWFGWEEVARKVATDVGRDYRVTYDCTGTGTHDYRIEVMPQATPQFAVSSSPLKGVTCSR